MDRTFTVKEIAKIMGVSKQAIIKTLKKEQTPYSVEEKDGKKTQVYSLASLPAAMQSAYLTYNDTNGQSSPAELTTMLPALAPSVAIQAMQTITGGGDFDLAFSRPAQNPVELMTREEKEAYYNKVGPEFEALMIPRVQRIALICEEAEAIRPGWAKRKWVELIAEKHQVAWQSIYRWMDKREKKGLVGLLHTKSNKGEARVWTPEALNHWVGLCLLREHRKIKKKYLYNNLIIEADRRGWRIGSLASALQQYRDYPNRRLLETYQKGGALALDNALPPILRDYSDLAPFECLVGDQHRKNRWVVDDFTGEIVRIEAYVWQDLRTRIIYGGACAKHYDSYLMGLALRMGLRKYGAFGSVYTDNGKPEISLYFNGILKNIRSYGLDWHKTIKYPVDLLDVDPEDVYPVMEDPQLHRLAIVENAKAKMIEGTWRVLEDIMTSVFLLPGNSKRLTDDIHTQDIDQKELKKLAAAGKLPLMSQYLIAFYKAINYYNMEKPHRGVAKEWRRRVGASAPVNPTPIDCLKACWTDGWRPRYLSDQAIDLLFMAEEERTVNRGHIAAFNEIYVHDDLLHLHGEKVTIRYDLVDTASLLVSHQGRFICLAHLIEYGSMIDADLTRSKIHEKRAKAKEISDLYSSLTRPIDDLRAFGSAEQIEHVAALVASAKEKKQIEYRELNRELTQEELDAAVAKLEQGVPLPAKAKRLMPERPKCFLSDKIRFDWILEVLKADGKLDDDDEIFKNKQLEKMTPGEREYYDFAMNEYQGD